MKKFKKQNHSKIALFAGATALMALTPNIHAQMSGEPNDKAIHVMADLMWKF